MGRWTDEPEEDGWPVLMPSDLEIVQGAHELVTEAQTIMRQQAERIADLERERALLLAYMHATEAWRAHPYGEDVDAADEALDALRDAGLFGGDDE